MADKKISQLTAATTPLAGTEVLPIVQSGSTVKVAVSDLTAGRGISAASANISGNLIVDTNTLYVDATNNRVGINRTPSAGYNFDVDTSGGSYPRLIGSDQGNLRLRIENGGAGGRTWEIVGGLPGANNANFSVYDVTGTATRFHIDASGNGTLVAGNLVVGTAGKGIDFSANTHAAGMTSELLKWYEEGTWTPALEGDGGSAGSLAYTSAGKYTRVGRQVTVRGNVTVTVAGSWTGRVFITGVPFASEGNYVGSMWATAVTLSNAFTCVSQIGSYDNSYIQFPYSTDGAGNGNLNWSTNFSTGTIIFVLTYFV